MFENNKKHCHPELTCRDALSGRSEVKPETELSLMSHKITQNYTKVIFITFNINR